MNPFKLIDRWRAADGPTAVSKSSAMCRWPIIVGGPHRSGTSLFRRLLNGHPNIFCPPEIKFFMDLLGQYPKDPLSHVRLGSTINGLGLSQEIWLSEMGSAFVKCYELASRNHGKSRWADKNPDNAINVHHWDALLGQQFFFVLLVRHPFDTVASMDEIGMEKTLPLDLEGKAEHVLEYIEAGYHYVNEYPERSCVVRYESLVREPEETLTHVLARIGESYDNDMINGLFSDAHGSGLEDPKVKEHSRITASSVERWRIQFDDIQIQRLTTILDETCRSLGYNIER